MDKTFSYAKKTRELWAASYTFSYLMKCLINEFTSKGDILLPCIENKEDERFAGIGVYPDRLIMILTKPEELDADGLIKKALTVFCVNTSLNLEEATSYFQIYSVKISSADLENINLTDEDSNKSNIHKINHLLNCKELQNNYNPNSLYIVPKLFQWKTLQTNYELSFGTTKHSFESLRLIAAKDIANDTNRYLLNKDEEKLTDEDNLELKKLPFKKYHNYIAILHGDGDNFGKVISSLGNDATAIKTFSKKLVEFSLKAAVLITDYGSTPIYIGGDDIVCFVPVKNQQRTVFHLINHINEIFKESFSDNKYNGIAVSLSYGLSITYIKYPLNEALNKSRDLMKKEAKDKLLNPGKNGISIELLQHSGQQRKIILNFGINSNYSTLVKMIDSFNDNTDVLHSLIHQFIEDGDMLTTLCNDAQFEDRLWGYFNHHFSIENTTHPQYHFIKAVYEFFIAELKSAGSTVAGTLNKANAVTRLINFLNADNE
jgi:CRISPR-associated protein Cmr2